MCPSPGGFAVGRLTTSKQLSAATLGTACRREAALATDLVPALGKAIAPKATSRQPQRTPREPVSRDPPSQSGIITDKLSINLGADGRPLGERDDRTRSGPVVYLSLAQNEGDIGALGDRFVLQAEHIRGQQLQ
jgi:hypothetical protein